MKNLTIYIASSWKNQHAVQMLTAELRKRGHTILSFVENNHGENKVHSGSHKKEVPFEEWVWSDAGLRSFRYDIDGATKADLVVYISPSGTDAWAEVGAAYGAGIPIIGLWAKGEQAGLMRRLVSKWFDEYTALLDEMDKLSDVPVFASVFAGLNRVENGDLDRAVLETNHLRGIP